MKDRCMMSIRIFILPIIILCGAAGLAVGQPVKNLDDYLKAGLKNSPLLHDLENQVQSIGIDSARIRAGYKPQVEALADNAYAPIVNGWGYDEVISNGATLSDLVNINQRLISHRNLNNQLDSVRLQREGVRNNHTINERDLKNQITGQYISAYGSWRALEYNQKILQLLEDQDHILKSLTQSGVYNQTDYLTLLVTLREQRITNQEAELQFRDDLSMLNELCGITDTSRVALTEPHFASPFPLQATTTIFYNRFVIDSLQLENLNQRIDFQYQPRLSLYANGGYVSSLVLTPYKNFGGMIGMTMTLPIYDGHQRRMQHEQVRISENTRAWYADFFKSQYDQHASELQRQLDVVEKIIEDGRDQLNYVNGLIEANRKLLQTGDIPVTNYILSINNYLTANQSITQNEIRRLRILNEINYWK